MIVFLPKLKFCLCDFCTGASSHVLVYTQSEDVHALLPTLNKSTQAHIKLGAGGILHNP